MNNSIAGVWVKASELKDLPDVVIVFFKHGAYSYNTKHNSKGLMEVIKHHPDIMCFCLNKPDESQPIPVNQDEKSTEELMKDPFIQKHLARIWELTKDAKIELYIKPMFGGLSAASIKYFLETGTVNGDFYLALHKMMDGCKNRQSSQQPIPVQEGLSYELAKEAIDIIEGLVYFSQIHEVKGVVLPKGRHEDFWKRGQQFLWNKCRIIESEYFPKEYAKPKVQEGLREDETFQELVKDFTALYDLMLPLEELKRKYSITKKQSPVHPEKKEK